MDENKAHKEETSNSSKLDILNMVFTFLVVFATYLLSKGPASTDAQLYFRLGMMCVGILGLASVGVVKWRQKS